MDFSLSKSQEMLQKSARDFLKKDCKELVREAEETAEGYSPESWKKIAKLDWLAIGVPEEYNGIGGDMLDRMMVLKEMGYFLFPGPYIASAVCATSMILSYGTDAQKETFLPQMVDGDCVVVPATHRPDAFSGELPPEVVQVNANGDYEITGTRLFVPYAASADYFLVPVKPDNSEETFILIPSDLPGVTITTLSTIATDKQGEVVFEKVVVSPENILGNSVNSFDMYETLQNMGAIAHSAYILGMLEKVVDMTVDYAKNRVQFEKPIGQFQVIQHQLADMAIDLEQVRYLAYQAALKMDEGKACTKEVSMVKAKASDASRSVCLAGVKIHGGAGLIDEYDMQLYFRRAKAMELAFGDGDFHRESVARELGL